MSRAFVILQTSLHFLAIFLIIKILRLDMISSFFVLIGGWMVDLDSFTTVNKMGISGYWYARTKLESKPKLHSLHNLITLTIALIGILLILTDWTFYIGLFCASLATHLIIDFIFFLIRGGRLYQLIPES